MSSLGAMLDYAVNACGEDLDLFYARFLGSGIAKAFALANPKYIAGMSGIELAILVASRTGDRLPEKHQFIDVGSPEYWTGWTMAYLSWYLNLDFGALQSRGVTVQALRDRYSVLHEADLSKSVAFAMRRIQIDAGENRLKRARKNAGMTQQELAEATSVPIRAIRSYEQGQRSLGSAAAEKVRRICQSLGCALEDLLTLEA